MISILIVDDDINKINSIIDAIHFYYKNQVEIRQASNVHEAIEVLQKREFHLLITDLLMPVRNGERPIDKGGESLIREIYREKNKTNTPLYIIGLTQFEKVKTNFSSVWKVWQFDPSHEDWKIKLRDLIFHISKVNHKIVAEKKVSIFVEGPTDKDIIALALTLFHTEYLNKLTIETVSYGGGASWVERQLLIWAKTLFRKQNSDYLQALGLFDNDIAGRQAVDNLRNQISNSSAEQNTFSTLYLDRKYAIHLIPAYTAGLVLPITIEEMIAPSCWYNAKEKGWLTQRKLSEDLLEDPKKWDKTNQSLKDYLSTFTLPEETQMFVENKLKEDCKVKLSNYLKTLNIEEQKQALYAFEPLLADILSKLKLK